MKNSPKTNYILGKKPVLDFLKNQPQCIESLHYVRLDSNTKKLIEDQRVYAICHDHDHFFNQFAKNVNHQNFAIQLKPTQAFLNIIDFNFLEKKVQDLTKPAILIMVDEIMDMQNFGAILRTAYAADVVAVIFKKDHQAQINDYIVKTSMGFIHKIPLLPVVNLSQAITKLKAIGFWIYVSSLDSKKTQNYEELQYDRHVALIIGSEQKGVSQLLCKQADYLIQIPMQNKVESLNASVACGVLLFGIQLIRRSNEKKSNH